VSDVVALPGAFVRTVSEAAWVLSAAKALSGRTVSEVAREALLVCMLSVRAGWLSEGAWAVPSAAGACAEVAGGTIKTPDPSNQVVRRAECSDINGLACESGCGAVDF